MYILQRYMRYKIRRWYHRESEATTRRRRELQNDIFYEQNSTSVRALHFLGHYFVITAQLWRGALQSDVVKEHVRIDVFLFLKFAVFPNYQRVLHENSPTFDQ